MTENWRLASHEMPPDDIWILTWAKEWPRPDVAMFRKGKVRSGWLYDVPATHWRVLQNAIPYPTEKRKK